MQWRGRRGSSNIEDRRRSGGRGGGTRVGRGGLGGLGIGGVVVVLAVGYFFGIDVTPLLTGGSGSSTGYTTGAPAVITQADEDQAQFVSVTLADTEEVWGAIFPRQVGKEYTPATLVLFKQVTDSPCGDASGATGPFYCPLDRKVYLDTAFFTTLADRMGAGGDFAAAYVVAHEIGPHVQDELGVLRQTAQARQSMSETQANGLSVRTELQADCLAGIWASAAGARFGSLDPGDVEEAMNAAKEIGDDTLQREAGRVPSPHTFTHGTSAQRQRWFATGYESGQIASCDTFSAQTL